MRLLIVDPSKRSREEDSLNLYTKSNVFVWSVLHQAKIRLSPAFLGSKIEGVLVWAVFEERTGSAARPSARPRSFFDHSDKHITKPHVSKIRSSTGKEKGSRGPAPT